MNYIITPSAPVSSGSGGLYSWCYLLRQIRSMVEGTHTIDSSKNYMKIQPEHKVTVKQVKDAFYRYMQVANGPYRNTPPDEMRHNWKMFWCEMHKEIVNGKP